MIGEQNQIEGRSYDLNILNNDNNLGCHIMADSTIQSATDDVIESIDSLVPEVCDF